MRIASDSVKRWLQKRTPKFLYINRTFSDRTFSLLDVGSGNHSASKTKKLFPLCEYHGIDLQKDFNNDQDDYDAMTAFYEMDLTQLDFHSIPNAQFDFIRMTHVIEHLFNGDEVIKALLPKLKVGGYIYIEYPGKKSLTLPSMQGTLNFYDDSTHCRIYSVPELTKVMQLGGCKVLSSGTRRSLIFLLAMPFRIIIQLLKGLKLQGNYFWDLLGFAEYIYAVKKYEQIE